MLTGRRCNPRSRVRSTSSEVLLDPHRSTNHLEGAAPRCSQGSMVRWRYQSKDSPEPDLYISVMQTRCDRTRTHTHCMQVHHLYHVRNCTLQLFTRGLRPLRTRVLLLCCGSWFKTCFRPPAPCCWKRWSCRWILLVVLFCSASFAGCGQRCVLAAASCRPSENGDSLDLTNLGRCPEAACIRWALRRRGRSIRPRRLRWRPARIHVANVAQDDAFGKIRRCQLGSAMLPTICRTLWHAISSSRPSDFVNMKPNLSCGRQRRRSTSRAVTAQENKQWPSGGTSRISPSFIAAAPANPRL